MATVANKILDYALEYAGRGWLVVPLRDGKIPRLNDWPSKATTDEDTIIEWWEQHPEDNLGIKLGAESGIIDIECDDAEAEEIMARLWDKDLPITPIFSGKRGKHRLFKFRDDLPAPTKNNFKIGALEFRTGYGGKAAQSVFPPSIHPDTGKPYKWLITPDETDLADIPDEVVARLWNWTDQDTAGGGDQGFTAKGKEYWEKIFKGTNEGGRHDNLVSMCGKLLRGVENLNDEESMATLYQSVLALNERNAPPLDVKEVKQVFTDILKREGQRRTGVLAQTVISPSPEDQVNRASGEKNSQAAEAGWKLVIVESDPRRYEIYAPQFSRADRGCIVVNADQMNKPLRIRVEALEQADCALPAEFGKLWNKQGGLLEQLVGSAEHREAPLEDNRKLVVAERFLEKIEKAQAYDEERPGMVKSGIPVRLNDGSVVFLFNRVWSDLEFTSDKITRLEFSTLLQHLGAVWWKTPADRNLKLKRLKSDAVERLRGMIDEFRIVDGE